MYRGRPQQTIRVGWGDSPWRVRAVTDNEPTPSPSDVDSTVAPSSKAKPLGLILTFAVALVGLGGVAFFFMSQSYVSPNYPNGVQVATSLGTQYVNGQTVQHVSLAFNAYPDSTGTVNGKPVHSSGNPSWPAYGMTNEFQVPAHSLVTMTIHQYDSGGALNNPWFAKVAGTVDGTVTITDPLGKTEKVTHWDPNNVGHTFTMRSVPGVDSNFFLNVPLPTNADLPNNESNPDAGQSYTVKFSFMSGNKGSYAWNCEFPCGQMVASFGGVMSAYGFMSGFVHVV